MVQIELAWTIIAMLILVSNFRHLSIDQVEENTTDCINQALASRLLNTRQMLKISIKRSRTKRVLVLEGKIIAPWTNELTKAACHDLTNHGTNRELVVDLPGVTDISADGEEALYCLMVQGVRFRGGGVFIKHVLKQLAQRMRRNDEGS